MSKKKKQFSKKQNILSKKQKKISFFAAILLVIGSSIGAGSFLKNKEILSNCDNSVILLILSWVLSIVAVICMAISLVEITSGSTNDNGGLVSWNKSFNGKLIFKTSKNFMAYIYMPLTFFLMPYYAVMSFQDAFGWQTQWWIAAIIALIFAMWFIVISGLSSWMGNIQNQVFSYLKFIPLVFVVIIGIICVSLGQSKIGTDGYPTWIPTDWGKHNDHNLLSSMFPLLGLVASIPAILFTFDGFYSACGVQSEMQEPGKIGNTLVIGLLLVSAFDIVIAISLALCSTDGKIGSISFLDDKNLHWIIAIMEIIIAFGVLGILNSMAMWTPRFYEYLIKNDELWVPIKYRDRLNDNKPIVGTIYTIIISLIFFFIFTIIGVFGYIDINGYSSMQLVTFIGDVNKNCGYGINDDKINILYSFVDLMGNWTSVFAFVFIVFALIGGIKNRKTNIVKTNNVRGFMPCAIISSLIICLGLLFLFISTIVNIPIVVAWHADIGVNDYTNEQWIKDIVGVTITFVLLIAFILIMVIPAFVSIKKNEKSINIIK